MPVQRALRLDRHRTATPTPYTEPPLLQHLDSAFALAMATVAIAIFVFGLLLQRRREYVVLRAQGMGSSSIRRLIGGEAALVPVLGTGAGVAVGR